MKKLLTNIKQIVTPVAKDFAAGADFSKLTVLENHDILINDGIIEDFPEAGTVKSADEVLNCKNQVVMPAFVDPHTHIPFAGSREDEFNRRLKGQGYMEIAAAGGGINSTVAATREISEDDLFAYAWEQVQRLIEHGTATVEMKSGYGLNTETEMKQLRVIKRLQEKSPLDIKATFLGAHEIPREYKGHTEDYVKLVIEEMLPSVKSQGIAEYCDIFTEKGVFSVEQSRRIMTKAKELGFKLRWHADEIAPLKGAELAAELSAVTADHLGQISDEGITKMVESGTVFTLLPATLFFLMSETFAPARKIADAGGIIALSTDFNPGSSFTHSMPMVILLACLKMGLTIEEAINAATLNSSYALELSHLTGSLHIGKQADLITLDAPNYHYLVYNFGVNRVTSVMKKGEIIFSK